MLLFDVDGCHWVRVSPVDARALELFKRHYTYNPRRKKGSRFVGPGQEITLLSKDGKALFVWRLERFRNDDQVGVNCAVFRNEGDIISSELIKQAEEIALNRWPGSRLFTFVNASKVKSSNPGYCFKMAGWSVCGVSKKRKLIILEKEAV